MESLLLLILFYLCLASQCRAEDDSSYGAYPLNQQGFICEWLIAGPFPNDGKFPEFAGWDTDWLVESGGESTANPKPEQLVEWTSPEDAPYKELRWKPRLLESEEYRIFDYIVDLHEFFRTDSREIQGIPCISYAFCQLNADQAMDVVLEVNGDDGVKLWLNGKQLAANREFSNLEATTWKISGRLHQGANRLLLKVEDGGKGMHAFQVKVLDANEQPAKGVEVSF